MALRRHTHFTAAARPKKAACTRLPSSKPQNCSENKKVYKVQAAFSHPKAACTNKNPAAEATGLNKEASRTLGTDFFQWAADSRP